ncbi:phosphatidate cytidylyltransferase [Aestuariicoccus sp. MJ-SS9]|uniref:phosphatidate cytidylyltransferase n=1 Tax=Aestuariicoccus sp. MJ-SS9 TaxID=3079855 RepID=UPI00291338E3|nr:phosphatidate cytidylyltransferase [Aestuariicoccus sp. MJ-SS9]MDU8911435.1 phosphatidate cytidylyltransferase [Aestuariicoccus sp. MJ-SS9]
MTDEAIIRLFAFLIGVLTLATLGGAAMRWRYGRTDGIENFQHRTYAWWVMVAILTLAILAGRALTLALYAGLSALALYEFLRQRPAEIIRTPTSLAAFAVVIPIQYWLIWVEWYGLFVVFIPVYGFLLIPILAVLQGKTEGFLHNVSEIHWGLMLAVFSLSHVPALLLLDIPGFEGRNILLLAFLVLVVQSSDVLQYLWGKAVGRHKLAPSVSPSKTVEGLVGGVASACAVGAFFAWLTPFTRFEALLISFLAATMGFFGGFVLSAIKRDRGVKDWGVLIPGHGGILDRVDSLVFAAPVYFHFIRYWWSA